MKTIQSRQFTVAIPVEALAAAGSIAKLIKTGPSITTAILKVVSDNSALVCTITGVISVSDEGTQNVAVVPFDLTETITPGIKGFSGATYVPEPFPKAAYATPGQTDNIQLSNKEFLLPPNTYFELKVQNGNPAVQNGAFVMEITE